MHSWSYSHHNLTVDRSFDLILQLKGARQLARTAGHIHISIWRGRSRFWFGFSAGSRGWSCSRRVLTVDQGLSDCTGGMHSWSCSRYNLTVGLSFNVILQSKWARQLARTDGYIHIPSSKSIDVLMWFCSPVRTACHIHNIVWQPVEVLVKFYCHSEHASWYAQLVIFAL